MMCPAIHNPASYEIPLLSVFYTLKGVLQKSIVNDARFMAKL
jgi:hypothetical protein